MRDDPELKQASRRLPHLSIRACSEGAISRAALIQPAISSRWNARWSGSITQSLGAMRV